MATIEHVQANSVASSAHQNGLIDQVNANTGDISSLTTRTADLEAVQPPGAYYGQWTDDGAGSTNTQTIDTTGTGEKVTVFTNAVGTPNGMTMSGGTVTVTNAGLYLVTASIQLVTNNGTLIAMWVGNSSATSGAGPKLGPTSGYRSDALSATALIRLPANSPISVYAARWQDTPSIDLWKSQGNVLTVCYLGA